MEKGPASKNKKIIIISVIAAIVVALVLILAVLPHDNSSLTSDSGSALQAAQADSETMAGQNSTSIVSGEKKDSETESKKGSDKKNKESKEKVTDKKDNDNKSGDKTNEDSAGNNEKKTKAKLVIENGAASANTKEAVNGLHVYSPDSKDLEDYFSGQEIPLGTKVSIYVYNLASPVSLHIEHNGQVIADRTYPTREAWVNDDTVEFFEFNLEGDLIVRTSVASAQAAKPAASANAKPSDPVLPGRQGVQVNNTSKTGNTSSQSKNTSKNNTEKSFKVILENKVKTSDATLTVGYVNDKEQAINIKSGNKYSRDLIIGARALNYNSSKKLKLTAYDSDGKVLDSVNINTGTKKNPGANGFYITLSDNTKYVLDYADKASGNKETETKKQEQTTKQEEQTTKQEDKKASYKVTVKNDAESANTDEAVNGLHVYSPDDPDMEDIIGTKTLEEGTKLKIYAYPLASDIHLKIVHNGKTIADKDIGKMQAWVDDDKIEMFDLTLSGDLTVTSTAIEKQKPEEEQTEKPTEEPTEKPTEKPTEQPAEETNKAEYSVTIKDETGLSGLDFVVGYVDESSGTPVQVVLKNGDTVKEGETVGARVGNPTNTKLILKEVDGNGKVKQSVEITPGTKKNPSYGGFYIDNATENTTIILEKAE